MIDTQHDPLAELLVESERVVARPGWVYGVIVLAMLVAIIVIGLLLAVALPLAADFVIAIQRTAGTLSSLTPPAR